MLRFAIRTFLGWIVEGIELTIVPSALKDKDLHGATENVSGHSAASADFFCSSDWDPDGPGLKSERMLLGMLHHAAVSGD